MSSSQIITNINTIRFDIPKDNGSSFADIILPIIPQGSSSIGLSFTGFASLLSFNFAGFKSCYTIPESLTFSTIRDGVLLKTITITRGVYTDEQLTLLICDSMGNTTGIEKNADQEGFLIASDTSKLLTIRFLTAQDSLITRLLGLASLSTNISGSYINYDLGITGEFPVEYNFTSTDNALIKFGFSSNQNQNINDLQSIPLTILNPDVFEMNALTSYNSYSSSLVYNKFIGNITQSTIYYIRIRIENFDDGLLVNNINNLAIIATFEDKYTTVSA